MCPLDTSEELEPESVYGAIADCDFSSDEYEPYFWCARACETFAGAKVYALSLMDLHRLEYVCISTTGLDDLPYGVFVDHFQAHEIGKWEVQMKEEFGIEPVRWVDIPADRQVRCGRQPETTAA